MFHGGPDSKYHLATDASIAGLEAPTSDSCVHAASLHSLIPEHAGSFTQIDI